MTIARSLLYAALFYSATIVLSVAGVFVGLLARRPMLAIVLSWADLNNWLARHVLGIRINVEGTMPAGAHLIAVKHQSMFETTEMVRLTNLPVIVIKRELSLIPFVGWLMRRYGVIAVERSAGSKALRSLVQEGKQASASGKQILIFPEGTRVQVGQTPPLRSGFAALYRALELPVVPVAVDSGRLWTRGLIKRSGTITFRIGETIPPGLRRGEVEARVHAAINALESAPQASA